MGTRAFSRAQAGLAVLGILSGALLAGPAPQAFARTGPTNGGLVGSATTGFDISYPQCGTTFPNPTAFGVVGVNDGLANTLNPCFGTSSSYPSYMQSELYWAASASNGSTAQGKASLYANTADPGNMYGGKPIKDWPTSSLSSDPYGACTTTTVKSRSRTYTVGQNSTACAWQYGYNLATQDVSWLQSAASAINGQETAYPISGSAAGYPWWLDVETSNSWMSDTTLNVADLQGMVYVLQSAGATVGAYSTASQWGSITGGTSSTNGGTLYGIPDWIPGATTQAGAQSNCSLPSFTGGKVAVTQWTTTIDNDWSCV